jgi:hypothetical protein
VLSAFIVRKRGHLKRRLVIKWKKKEKKLTKYPRDVRRLLGISLLCRCRS